LDNYDSFTYNLVHILEPFVDGVDVIRNDQLDLASVDKYDRIVLSPGPGLPSESGLMPDLIERYHKQKPILGVCLGMQALAQHYDIPLKNLDQVRHGQVTEISFDGDNALFKSIMAPMEVGLYHSWIVDHESLPDEMQALAFSKEGVLMAMQHKELPLTGIQFHPESVMTPMGATLIRNWLLITDQKRN